MKTINDLILEKRIILMLAVLMEEHLYIPHHLVLLQRHLIMLHEK